MSVDRAAILAQTPHWYVAPFPNPLNVPYDDLAAVVRSAIDGFVWHAGDPDGLRVIAYGLYVGALSEADATERLQGTDEDLAGEFAVAMDGVAPFSDQDLGELARAVLRDRADAEMRPRDASEGWVVTLLELVAATRPQLLEVLLARDDASHVVLRWLLQRWSASDHWVRYADVVMHSDEAAWIAAAAFLSIAVRAHIERDETPPVVPGLTSSDARLIVSGILLTEIRDFGRRSQLQDEARERYEQFVATLRSDVAQALTTATAARKLRGVADENDTTLVALILEVAPRAAAPTFAAAGEGLLRGFFRPLMASDRGTDTEALPYLGPLVINDLAHIWVSLGVDDGLFGHFREGLRCDEFAYAFTFGHYLTDRPRAVVLAAIGAVAGTAMQNEALLEAARALARDLHSLPAEGGPALDPATIESVRERTGVLLPEQ
jgi:hypothetical protein